jgi:hypothetical protein
MTDEGDVIRSGPLKGKRVELAPAGGIELFHDIADRFMSRIFHLEPGDYLVTDESSLTNFVGMDDLELADLSRKVKELYGLDVSDVDDGNFLQIFLRIAATDSD